MTIIALECPVCRLTETVPAAELLAEMLEPARDEETGTGTARICWICATCSDLALVDVSADLLDVLVAAGVTLLETDAHAMTVHPEAPAPGTPFTTDDLLELHERLDSDSWFDELTSMEPPPAVA